MYLCVWSFELELVLCTVYNVRIFLVPCLTITVSSPSLYLLTPSTRLPLFNTSYKPLVKRVVRTNEFDDKTKKSLSNSIVNLQNLNVSGRSNKLTVSKQIAAL